MPAPGMTLTRLLVVSDLERATAWYRDMLGADAQGSYGTSSVLRFLDAWPLLLTGGGD